MSQPSVSSARVERDIVEYGRFSGWALAALLLGVLSATAIVAPLLWSIPVLALVISLIAMKKIKTSEGRLTGWRVALLGLLLAVFFGMAGPVHTASRRYLIETRAAHFAAKFMQLLQQHQPLEAFQLTRPAAARTPLTPGQTDPYAKDPAAKKAYGEFLDLALVKMLLDAGQQAKIDLLSATYYAGDDSRDLATVKYQIQTPEKSGGVKSTALFMYVERTLAYGSHTEQWRIIPPALREEENDEAGN